MKIGEILSEIKKKDQTLATVAQQIKGISEKPLRQALKDAGYTFSNKEPKGWHYTGSEAEPIDKSIFDYVKRKATAKKKTNSQQSTKETKKKSDYNEIKPTNIPVKKVTYEIEEWIHDDLKIRAIREKRKVSDIVNELLKKGLR